MTLGRRARASVEYMGVKQGGLNRQITAVETKEQSFDDLRV